MKHFIGISLLSITLFLTGCYASQTDQKVPEGWYSFQSVPDAILALPKDQYDVQGAIIMDPNFPLRNYYQEILPTTPDKPYILISKIELSLSDRYDLFRNGPKPLNFLYDHYSFFEFMSSRYLEKYTKIKQQVKFNSFLENQTIFQTQGENKATFLVSKGSLQDVQTKKQYVYWHLVQEKYGEAYIISFFIEKNNFNETTFWDIAATFHPK